jgi:hypothetical protein
VDLENKPRYEALSYTWKDYHAPYTGAGEKDNDSYTTIYVAENGNLEVISHLAQTLGYIHDILVQPGSTRRLWCDEISVNQKNLIEQGLQVSLVGKIYSRAERTLLWPGECDGHMPAFLDLIRHLFALPINWSKGSLDLHDETLLNEF